jgi:hypothetical protein
LSNHLVTLLWERFYSIDILAIVKLLNLDLNCQCKRIKVLFHRLLIALLIVKFGFKLPMKEKKSFIFFDTDAFTKLLNLVLYRQLTMDKVL